MASSVLSGPALAASRAALSAALADQDQPGVPEPVLNEESLEPGEIQEVDMQAQAEGIRTVFNDPTNFNVKVRGELMCDCPEPDIYQSLASSVLPVDPLVRLACNKRSQSTPDTHDRLSPDSRSSDTRCGCCPGLDGGYQKGYHF